jgi:hypothetical protein
MVHMMFLIIFWMFSLLSVVESNYFEWTVGAIPKETCNQICKQRKLSCDSDIIDKFSCLYAAMDKCNNPYVHEANIAYPTCSVGGGCFINCGEWTYASIARSNGTCGENDCYFSEDTSLRILCPCISETVVEEEDDALHVETTPREYMGLSILVITFSMILVWLLYCSCSLQIFTW